MHDSTPKYRWDHDSVREYEMKLAEAEEKTVVVRHLKNMGVAMGIISMATGLSEEEIMEVSDSTDTGFYSIQKYRWDNENVREYEVKEAIVETEKRVTYSVAREMKKDGIPYEQIARFTKLSVEEIEKL